MSLSTKLKRTSSMGHCFLTILAILTLVSCKSSPANWRTSLTSIDQIAFGSCARENKPQPIWQAILESDPDLFLFLGDNIYGDTEDMKVLRQKYETLGKIPEYARFRKSVPIYATWDDHDYGVNDGGQEYPKRAESQKEFLRFFNEPEDSIRWKREGIYDSQIVGKPGQRVQIILLDLRYFRTPLTKRPDRKPEETRYLRVEDSKSTFLGEAQWKWLEGELKKEADFRLIVSSLQLLTDGQRGENWLNFPLERKKLFDLIQSAQAEGVIFLSGDSHYAELAHLKVDGLYTFYDLTSSSLNQGWVKGGTKPNKNRFGDFISKNNFGVLDFDWSGDNPSVLLSIRGEKGETLLAYRIWKSDLKMKK